MSEAWGCGGGSPRPTPASNSVASTPYFNSGGLLVSLCGAPPAAGGRRHDMLGAQLRELRERAGLTQQQLATRAGLSWSTVAHIEQGRKPDLRVSTLVRLAGALGVPPTELFEV